MRMVQRELRGACERSGRPPGPLRVRRGPDDADARQGLRALPRDRVLRPQCGARDRGGRRRAAPLDQHPRIGGDATEGSSDLDGLPRLANRCHCALAGGRDDPPGSHSRDGMRARSIPRGFSVVEALVSMLILTLAVLTLTTAYPYAFGRIGERDDELQGVSFGQQYLEEI